MSETGEEREGEKMEPIVKEKVQSILERFVHQEAYLHLETTNGAYAAHHRGGLNAGAYIRNGRIHVERAIIAGNGPYRVGLKISQGWVYAEGLTDWEVDQKGRLLLAGHDQEGHLAVAMELSRHPFE